MSSKFNTLENHQNVGRTPKYLLFRTKIFEMWALKSDLETSAGALRRELQDGGLGASESVRALSAGFCIRVRLRNLKPNGPNALETE